ncbi:hypothetical protein GCM10010218_54080 [Streptomyces mashuensis]|uniref:Uncharacterized protein n=1 Tax=Streptomyces mashuensis TaxID=33904 RepID=A0A919EFJ0_9ACTN|nr:hypothetical protein GCM10010218_54080 [Streptomyces mashuensis]
MVAREPFLLQHPHLMALAGQDGRGGRARRAASDHQDIGLFAHPVLLNLGKQRPMYRSSTF